MREPDSYTGFVYRWNQSVAQGLVCFRAVSSFCGGRQVFEYVHRYCCDVSERVCILYMCNRGTFRPMSHALIKSELIYIDNVVLCYVLKQDSPVVTPILTCSLHQHRHRLKMKQKSNRLMKVSSDHV